MEENYVTYDKKLPTNNQVPEQFNLDLSNIPMYDQGSLASSTACCISTVFLFQQYIQKNNVPINERLSKLELYMDPPSYEAL